MYSIIIGIHALFVLISHFLGYRIFEWIFLLLGIFFLFYFSPLFFLDETISWKNTEKKEFGLKQFFEKISPKDSLFLPLLLLYIAVYGFVISAFWTIDSFLSIHSILSIGIFLILFGYILSFDWKNDIFFEVFQFHTYIAFISSILFGILFFIEYSYTSFLFFLLTFFSSIAGIFFLSFSRKIHSLYTSLLLTTFISSIFIFIQYFFHFNPLFLLIFLVVLMGISMFEYLPKIEIFAHQKEIIRYFSLIIIILSLPVLFFLAFSTLTIPFFLLLCVMGFFFSIHIRYSNYIAYGIGLAIIYFLYSLFFFSLLSSGSIISVLLFIFFLPFLLIGITYFWEERFEYDFPILHYSAIGFSGIYFLYSIFFIGWWNNFLFMISSGIFCLAILFFMSFFRFRK